MSDDYPIIIIDYTDNRASSNTGSNCILVLVTLLLEFFPSSLLVSFADIQIIRVN